MHGAIQRGALDLELPCNLPALPVGLAAVALEETENRLAGEKRVVQPQIADAEAAMADDLA